MTDSDGQQRIQQVHESPHQFVLALTGGGSGAISALLETPGASQTLLSGLVPYAAEAMQDFLGEWDTSHPCSQVTARQMAVQAFLIAYDLGSLGEPVHGVACTASLASNRPKRGDHRIYVATQSADRTVAYSLVLEKNARTRQEEEAVATSLVLDAVAHASGLQDEGTAHLLREGESLKKEERQAPSDWPKLGPAVAWRADQPSTAPVPKLLFPGSFNPLHSGHLAMAEAAERLTGERLTYELSVENAAKPPLDFLAVAQRVAQFGERPYLVTRAPTFVDKASLMPGCQFVVGADTLARIADPLYYGEDESQRNAAIRAIADAGCRFLAFGRVILGQFVTLPDLELPSQLRALCEGVSEKDFRLDMSSTDLRESNR